MNIKQISLTDAKEHFDNKTAEFFDIRDPMSFERSHIEGAKQLNDSNLEEFLATADKSKTYIIYCYHGNSSQSACAYLYDQGFENAYSMIGGFTQWDLVYNS